MVTACLGAAAAATAGAGACGARSELRAHGPDAAVTSCDDLTAAIEPASLAAFLLVDSSGSMEAPTEEGESKWLAVTEAMSLFLSDPASAGTLVGLAFFPEIDDAVPTYCLDSAACGQPGACRPLGTCMPSNVGLCQTNAGCFDPGDYCQQLGLCEENQSVLCDLAIAACPALDPCLPAGFCENRARCEDEAYDFASVGLLPDDAESIVDALGGRALDGFTPTLPALSGALASVASWREEHPAHTTVLVLATDGLPTACDPVLAYAGVPEAIANVAEVAAQGVEDGVPTFVVGVFAPEEQAIAQQSLDTVAAAGDTGQAYVVTTAGDVVEKLAATLRDIRLAASCQYSLPAVVEIDLTTVKVRIDGEGYDPVDLAYVGDSSGCDPVTGGFYFDVEPLGPEAPPKRLILCPASCDLGVESLAIVCPAEQAGDAGPADADAA